MSEVKDQELIKKLESKLNLNLNNIDVVNAGIDGQSTYGHIWNFEEWFVKLDNFIF